MAVPMVAPPNTFGLGDQRNIFTSAAARPMPPRSNDPLLPRANQVATPTSAPTTPGSGPFGDENTLGLVRQSPEAAIAAYRRARGQTGRDKSYWGDYREAQMGQALQSLLVMLMPPDGSDQAGPANPVDLANQLAQQMIAGLTSGHGYGGVLRQQAARIQPADLSNYTDKDILQILGAQQAAAGLGYGNFAQMPLDNAYADLENLAQQYGLEPNYDPNHSAIAGSAGLAAFNQLLQRYFGTK